MPQNQQVYSYRLTLCVRQKKSGEEVSHIHAQRHDKTRDCSPIQINGLKKPPKADIGNPTKNSAQDWTGYSRSTPS